MSAELTSGHISLTVKYGDAMKQIQKDLLGLDKTATKAGTDAGKALQKSLLRSSDIDSRDVSRNLAGFEKGAKSTGDDAGEALSKSLIRSSKISPAEASKALNGFRQGAGQAGDKAGRELADSLLDSAKGRLNGGKGLLDDIAGGAEAGGSTAGGAFAGGFLSGFGPKIAKLGTKAGPIGAALFGATAIAVAAGAVVGKEFMSGVDREMQRREIQAKVGLNPQDAQRVYRQAEQAYGNNFGASIEENVAAATALVQSGLADADSPDLQKLIEQIQTVSQVTGEIPEELIRGISSGVKSGFFDDLEEGLDAVTAAQQKGLNVSGDVLDTLNEYSVQFQKVGIDGPQALGLINQLMEGGARSTDLAADAIKEFSIRAIDGSQSTVDAYTDIGLNAEEMAQKLAAGGPLATEAFDQVVDSLLAIEDPVRRNANGVALFGTQWEDLGPAVNSLDVSGAVNEFSDLSGAVEQAGDALGTGPTAGFETFNRQMEVARGQFQDFLTEALGPVVAEVGELATDAMPTVIDVMGFLGEVGITTFQGLLNFIGDTTMAVGHFAAGIGDTLGVMTRGVATVNRALGRDEIADELDSQADAYFGWGESIIQTGQDIKDQATGLDSYKDKLSALTDRMSDATEINNALGDSIELMPDGKTISLTENPPTAETKAKLDELGLKIETMPDGSVKVVANTEDAATKLDNWRANEAGEPITQEIRFVDQNGNPISPDQLRTPGPRQAAFPGDTGPTSGGGRARGGRVDPNGIIRGPGTGTSDSILARVMGGSLDFINVSNKEAIASEQAVRNGWPLIDALNKGWVPSPDFLRGMFPGFAGGGGLNPGAKYLRDVVMQQWPIETVGGYRGEDGYGEHSSGNALDIMIPNYGSAQGIALGNEILSFLVTNKEALGLDGVIWRQATYGYGGSFTSADPMEDRGSDTQNHMDHLHVILGEGRGEGAAPVDVPSSPLSLPSGGSVSGFGGSYLGGSGGASQSDILAADSKIATLADEQKVLEQELSELMTDVDSTESDKAAKRAEIAENKREQEIARAERAELDLQSASGSSSSSAQTPYAKIMEGISEIVGDAPGQLADIGLGGLKESLLPPGFSDPQEWGLVQAGSGLLNFLGGWIGGFPGMQGIGSILSGIGAGVGGDASGAVNSLMSLLPAPFGDAEGAWGPAGFTAAQPHQGTGALPGPGNVASAYAPDSAMAGAQQGLIDQSIHIGENGQVGADPVRLLGQANRQQSFNQRPQLGTRRINF